MDKEKEVSLDDISESKLVKNIVQDVKSIDSQVVFLGCMIILLCVGVFFMGYYVASQTAVKECNEFIADNYFFSNNMQQVSSVPNNNVSMNFPGGG